MPASPPRTTRLDHVLIVGLALGPLVGLIAAITIAWREGAIGGVNLGLFLGFWFATFFGIEVGYHRYFSHRSFRTGRVVEALMIIFGSMSFQGPAIWWAATHRKHHKHADRPGDPHSPHLAGGGHGGMVRGLWDAHMGWNFRAYQTIRDRSTWKHLVPDLIENRWLRAVNRGYFLWMALGLALPAVLGGALTGSWHGALTGFLWGGLVRLFAVNHGVYAVNSLCHGFGSRPYALHSRDRSTNHGVIALLTFGAGYHHNHHVFPGSASNRIEPWQLDLGGAVLRTLSWVGVVWDLGQPPADARDRAWRRRLRVRVDGSGIDRIGGISGLSENGVFVELGVHGAARVGSRVTLREFSAVGDSLPIGAIDGVVERATWHGVAVRFDLPNAQLAEELAAVRRRTPGDPALTWTET